MGLVHETLMQYTAHKELSKHIREYMELMPFTKICTYVCSHTTL